ncbi:hypothetical protein [Acinetobacter bereziniae]|uniref:hypothetical protein n=1 Tax=Acinetobacter bereziniae TaxID=106648 RepID=UPI0029552699|nr:hypothetical protein [Acinetobacter bereziniae]MDV8155221.1 hypothetical protein [Acinetobacter bereziniae]
MDKCREAFERHQADLTGTDYEVLKAHFDINEQHFGSRYNEGSLYERDWGIWEACWQSRQAEVDQLKEAMERQGKLAILAMNEAHKGSRLELSIAKDIQASLKPELIESERQMNAQLTDENMKLEARIEEKDKRIAHLVKRLNELVGLAVDDLEETLRGEHE